MGIATCGDQFTNLYEQSKLVEIPENLDKEHAWHSEGALGLLKEAWNTHAR
jgi:hypothetical protein